MRNNLFNGIGKYKHHTASKIVLSYCRRQFSRSYLLSVIAVGAIFIFSPAKAAEEKNGLSASGEINKTEQRDLEQLQHAEEYYAAGRKYIREGNYVAANNEFKKALKILETQPQEVSVRKESVITAAPVKAAVPTSNEANSQGKAAENDSPQEKISYYLKVIRRNPKNADLHYNLALEYMHAGQLREAEEELIKVIQINPKDRDAYYNLGVLNESYFNKTTQAVYYYKKYIKLSPRSEDVSQVKSWLDELINN